MSHQRLKDFTCAISTNLPTFAERVKNSVGSRLKRPTCLNLKTKSNLKRHEVIDLLNELNFDSGKLIGVAEMRSRSIDITCKKRENVLELFEILKKCDSAYNVRLYESEHVNVLLGWVPIPLSNDIIKKSIEEVFGKVIKITEKRHKDGLQSGIRLISMSKNDVEMNPLPSYIYINGYELYVTYPGQAITCKYCGETGHMQAECKKRKSDFPALQKNSTNRYYDHFVNNSIQIEPNNTNLINGQESPINLSKKRKRDSDNQSEVDSNQFTTQAQNVVLPQNEDTIEDCIAPIELNANLQMDLTRTFDDVVSQSFDNHDKNNESSWWYMSCKTNCLSCKTENLIKETSQSFLCVECGEEQQVARPCCEDETSLDRFPVKLHEQFTNCVKCKSEMVRLPCCKQFQPKLTKEKYLYDCVQCSKYSLR